MHQLDATHQLDVQQHTEMQNADEVQRGPGVALLRRCLKLLQCKEGQRWHRMPVGSSVRCFLLCKKLLALLNPTKYKSVQKCLFHGKRVSKTM